MFSFGKKLLSGIGGGDDKDGSNLSNPFAMFEKLDRDGDGKISENGRPSGLIIPA